jgi:hypothetical protein
MFDSSNGTYQKLIDHKISGRRSHKLDFSSSDKSVSTTKITKQIDTVRELTSVNFCDSDMDDDELAQIAHSLAKKTTLQHLNFNSNLITVQSVPAIAKIIQQNNSLAFLALNNNHLGPSGVQALAPVLMKSEELNFLDLNENAIGDEGAKAIASVLETNNELEVLWLANNNIGEEGIEAIVHALKNNMSLRILDLSGNNLTISSHNDIEKYLERNQIFADLSELGEDLAVNIRSNVDSKYFTVSKVYKLLLTLHSRTETWQKKQPELNDEDSNQLNAKWLEVSNLFREFLIKNLCRRLDQGLKIDARVHRDVADNNQATIFFQQNRFPEILRAVQTLKDGLNGEEIDCDLEQQTVALEDTSVGNELVGFIKNGWANLLVEREVTTLEEFLSAVKEVSSEENSLDDIDRLEETSSEEDSLDDVGETLTPR